MPTQMDPEDGRTAIFRKVDFIYFIYYILFTIKTMDKVLVTSGSQCHIPSSNPFRIQLKLEIVATLVVVHSFH
jgi:hypothetical protein